jgi:hypothetical protein
MTVFTSEVDEDGNHLLDTDRVAMTMTASGCPILVRRDPKGDWCIIHEMAGGYAVHTVRAEQAVLSGVTPWQAAIDGARKHVTGVEPATPQALVIPAGMINLQLLAEMFGVQFEIEDEE